MSYDIRARSRLVPAVPITSPQFVYRRARDTDVRATFARVRAALDPPPDARNGVNRDQAGARSLVAEAPC